MSVSDTVNLPIDKHYTLKIGAIKKVERRANTETIVSRKVRRAIAKKAQSKYYLCRFQEFNYCRALN